ncbi:uncharacterized protein LOC117824609 [Notolabrus celidotus]|uniref:uncharacterized protein LOC117824609 n=1 Tax=Notolabrus celidotus TaxID=1203425 RepID=UPI0014906E71|nr:uncharacterized protein LOC117824609 [Notolabrus celidotus]
MSGTATGVYSARPRASRKSPLENIKTTAPLELPKRTAEWSKNQSDQYNKRTRGLPLSLGDQVLVANKGVRGKKKLSDKWNPLVYTVVDSKPALHIYRIRDRDGRERVVHRNLLLQVNFLPLDVSLDDDATVVCLNDGLSMSGLPGAEMSVVDSEAERLGPSLAGSLSSWLLLLLYVGWLVLFPPRTPLLSNTPHYQCLRSRRFRYGSQTYLQIR